MRRRWRLTLLVIAVFVLTLLGGCSSAEPEGPGASVTPEQAKTVAQEQYGVTEIDDVNLRHLTEEELTLRNEEQSELTPIYYVIKGLVEDKLITVYVSSNEQLHHFSRSETP